MSIATELERLRSAKSALKTSITAKGVAVADSVTIDGYATLVDSIVVNGGTGGGVDTSNDTVTADVMLEGFTAHDKNGILITGTIATAPTVLFNGGLIFVTKGYVPEDYTVEVPIAVATLSANVVEVPAGYYPNPQTLTVAEAGNITVFDNVITVPVGYIKTERTVTIPEAKAATVDGNVVTIYPGFVTKEQTIEVPSGGGDIDLSGVTATAEEVLEGYQFVNKDGELTEGNIPIYQISDIIPTANAVFISPGYYAGSDREITIGNAIAPGTITPGTADIVLSQGSFLIEDVTIKGDANLIAANIAEGVTIFDVAGTHAGGSGGGGTDVPFPNDPTVYISFQNSTTADTGQAMTVNGSPTITTLWDVPCAEFHKVSGEAIRLNDRITLHGSLTLSAWFYPGGLNGGKIATLHFTDSSGNYERRADIVVDFNSYRKRAQVEAGVSGNSSSGHGYSATLDENSWNHFCIVVDAETQISALYINGERCATDQLTYSDDRNELFKTLDWGVVVGNTENGTSCKGHVASYRVYDRILSDAEIKKIYESDIAPNIPLAEGKFTVTGDEWVAGVYYAEPGTKGAGRRWMTVWDGESEERMGIMFDGTFWIICTFLAMYEETEDGDYIMTGEWEPGYEAYYDPSRQFDENFENLIGEPLGMGVAAPDMAGVWCSAGDPTEGQVTVVYGEYTPPDVTITDDPYKDTYWMRAKSSGTSTNVIVTKLTKQKIGLNGRPTFNNDFNTMAGTWKYGYFSDHDGWVLVDALGHDMFRSKNETTEIVGEYVGVGDYAGWTAEVSETQDGE